jgi:hypothetical protein
MLDIFEEIALITAAWKDFSHAVPDLSEKRGRCLQVWNVGRTRQ